MTSRSLRWGALAGTAFFLAVMFGNQMAQAGLTEGTDDASALADLHHRMTVGNKIGLGIVVLGFGCLFFFVGALYRCLSRAEPADGWLAGVATVAATGMLAVKLGSASFEVAARYHTATIGAATASTLHNLGDGAFVISGLFAAVFVLAASLSALGSAALPRWIGWAGVVVGVAGLITPTVALHDPSSYVPIPWLLTTLWIAIVGVVLFRRLSPAAAEKIRPATVATRVSASA